MLKRFSNNAALISILIDSILVVFALRLAVWIRPSLNTWAVWIRDIKTPPTIEPRLYFLFATVWVIVFFSFSLYDPQKHLKISEELSNLVLACLVVMVVIPGMLYFVERQMSRVLFISFALIASTLLISYRMIYRLAFQKGLIKTHENRRILIVGAGLVGRNFGEEMRKFEKLGFKVVGYIDDDPDLIQKFDDVVGNLDQIEAVIKDLDIQHLIIALPRRAHSRTNFLVSQVHKLPVRVWVIPDYFALALNKASVTEFAGFPLIDLRAPALSHFERLTKRVFDLLVGIPFILVGLPLFGIIALLILIDSGRPVFYHSKRIKENGEIFDMLKFRTMTKDAHKHLKDVIRYDEDGNIIHKHPDDPRITNIGKLLRKTSLDELPNLFNIIKGDMSLVGPRPELPEMVDLYEPWQRARFSVPQGLTGWWQIHGRSDKPMHLHTDEDLYYIHHYSIWLDIQILLKTILIVIKGRGAY